MFYQLSPLNEEAGFFRVFDFQFLRTLDRLFSANFTASLIIIMPLLSHSDCLSYYSEKKKKTKHGTPNLATPSPKHTL